MEVSLKRLDGIRRPYASIYSISNGLYSVNNAVIEFEKRKDDEFLKFEEEPPAPQIDYHAPANNKLNTRPSAP